eukprot:scaffold18987_cov109-Isochrysis_galbana.AAC.23
MASGPAADPRLPCDSLGGDGCPAVKAGVSWPSGRKCFRMTTCPRLPHRTSYPRFWYSRLSPASSSAATSQDSSTPQLETACRSTSTTSCDAMPRRRCDGATATFCTKTTRRPAPSPAAARSSASIACATPTKRCPPSGDSASS